MSVLDSFEIECLKCGSVDVEFEVHEYGHDVTFFCNNCGNKEEN